MIDWHSHILPGMDDGSSGVPESIALLQLLSEQGVDTAVATPHFYANDNSVDDFLGRRQDCFEKLINAAPECSPKIVLGTEVQYYSGISRLENLPRLCTEGSRLLLLEMPFGKWTEYTVREVAEIANARGLKVILAHVERYLSMQSRNVWQALYDAEILMQVNASFFAERKTRRKALSMLKNGEIHLIGSDCHNIRYRPPRLGEAYDAVRQKFGDELAAQMNRFAHHLLTIQC